MNLDLTSFLWGFSAATVLWWLVQLARPLFSDIKENVSSQVENVKSELSATAEYRYRLDVMRWMQNNHLASPLFSLHEIAVEPRLLSPPKPIEPGGDIPPDSITSFIVPYLPDMPEFSAVYHADTMTLPEALSGGANLLLVGNPGSGKTFALSQLAFRVAEKDPELSKDLTDKVPIMLHAGTLSLPVKKEELTQVFYDAMWEDVGMLVEDQLAGFMKSVFKEKLALLMIDGFDELPPEGQRPVVEFLSELMKAYPGNRLILSGSVQDLSVLQTLNLYPIPMAAWSREQTLAFLDKWRELWLEHVLKESWAKGLPKKIDPFLLNNWLLSAGAAANTPLIITLKTWAAYAGDLPGISEADALDAYIERMSVGINNARPALEQMAVQMVVSQTPVIARNAAGKFISSFEDTSIEEEEEQEFEEDDEELTEDVIEVEEEVIQPAASSLKNVPIPDDVLRQLNAQDNVIAPVEAAPVEVAPTEAAPVESPVGDDDLDDFDALMDSLADLVDGGDSEKKAKKETRAEKKARKQREKEEKKALKAAKKAEGKKKAESPLEEDGLDGLTDGDALADLVDGGDSGKKAKKESRAEKKARKQREKEEKKVLKEAQKAAKKKDKGKKKKKSSEEDALDDLMGSFTDVGQEEAAPAEMAPVETASAVVEPALEEGAVEEEKKETRAEKKARKQREKEEEKAKKEEEKAKKEALKAKKKEEKAQKKDKGKKKKAKSDVGHRRVRQILPSLIEANLLAGHQSATVGFAHPVFAGYLASKVLAARGGADQVVSQPAWDGRTLTLSYLAGETDVSQLFNTIVQSDQDDVLRRGLLTVAQWPRYAPRNAPWRNNAMRTMAGMLQQNALPMPLRIRILTSLAFSGEPAISSLFKQLLKSGDVGARTMGALGLGLIRDESAIPDLNNLIYDNDRFASRAACLGLVSIGTTKAIESLASALMTAGEEARRAAAEALSMHKEEGYAIIKEGVAIEDLSVRRAIVFGLARIDEDWATEVLEHMQIEDDEWIVRNAAQHILEDRQGISSAVPKPLPPLHELPWLITFASERGMGVSPGQQAWDMLATALKEGSEEHKLAAMHIFAQTPYEAQPVVNDISELLYSPEEDIQEAAYNTLWHLGMAGIKVS